jgi:regulatory protein
MKIISLKKKSNDIVITLEDLSTLKIDYRTFVDHRIHKDVDITDELLKLLSEESSFFKCKDAAFRFLSRRLHSTGELKLKLIKKNFSKETIEKVLTELKQKKYLNDEEFTFQYVKEKLKKGKAGIHKIENELRSKGIGKSIIDKIISQIDENNYQKNILELIKKKLDQIKNKETDKRKIKSKIISYLLSKGYDYELIFNSLKDFDLEQED